jgi:hypothetical protein
MTMGDYAALAHSNQNTEIRNKSEFPKLEGSKHEMPGLPSPPACVAFGRLEHLGFVFRICFVFRASYFGFQH